jgi:hypothetical protein
MSDETRERFIDRTRTYLAVLAATTAALAMLFMLHPLQNRGARPVQGDAQTAAWLEVHPADWIALSVVTDSALNRTDASRLALWREAYASASHLAPSRPNPRLAFLRSAAAHWRELAPAERNAALEAAVPLLRDPVRFRELATPLVHLTGNVSLLLRANSGTLDALGMIEDLAVSSGSFADYRAVREQRAAAELARLQQLRTTATPAELLDVVPARALTVDDEPLLRALLAELSARPLEPQPGHNDRLELLVDFAIRHGLRPLDGVAIVARDRGSIPDPLRARLALVLGDAGQAGSIDLASLEISPVAWRQYRIERALHEAKERDWRLAELQLSKAFAPGQTPPPDVLAAAEQIDLLAGRTDAAAEVHSDLLQHFGSVTGAEWSPLCAGEICRQSSAWIYAAATHDEPLPLHVTQRDQVPPYVELFIDDLRVAETSVASETTLTLPLREGLHHVQLRIVNPVTIGNFQRRVRIGS